MASILKIRRVGRSPERDRMDKLLVKVTSLLRLRHSQLPQVTASYQILKYSAPTQVVAVPDHVVGRGSKTMTRRVAPPNRHIHYPPGARPIGAPGERSSSLKYRGPLQFSEDGLFLPKELADRANDLVGLSMQVVGTFLGYAKCTCKCPERNKLNDRATWFYHQVLH